MSRTKDMTCGRCNKGELRHKSRKREKGSIVRKRKCDNCNLIVNTIEKITFAYLRIDGHIEQVDIRELVGG